MQEDYMKLEVKHSYNLDILNFINVLTGDPFYTRNHEYAYHLFNERISKEAKSYISQAVENHRSTMLGPFLTLVLSSVDDFEERKLQEILSDVGPLHDSFSKQPYYKE
jgi:hypothetical protein